MAKKKEVKSQQVKLVPIKYRIPDSIITRFANNMTVQIMESEFRISFFEHFSPMRLDPKEPFPKEVQANCVASIIVTADRLSSFIDVLQTQLNKYDKKVKPNK